jgi:spore photoproduct lyase
MPPDYRLKFESITENTLFPKLPQKQQAFVWEIAQRHRFTQQELRQVSEIALDLEMWGSGSIQQRWSEPAGTVDQKSRKKLAIRQLNALWNTLKNEPNQYSAALAIPVTEIKAKVKSHEKPQLGLGFCPVASAKTRCCNLLTLDAVDNCGYACSYCSIQSFFSDHQVFFDPEFPGKLANLELESDQTYHIGTGQSSDSLMWGNSHGVLDALMDFARNHPNVILELKTKSANVSHLLKCNPPANLICTWSLNPQTIVANEERGSAPLAKRLEAAQRLAEQGTLVGFHFHPMIHYSEWKQDYGDIFASLQRDFQPHQVAMISLGTLTFIKQVIRKIRERGSSSQILKLPLVEADGKLSYPDEIKQELFSFAYQSFSDEWKESVFFYLCMENQRFWKPIFGFDYTSNDRFEQAMKTSYFGKIAFLQRTATRHPAIR